MESNGFDKLFTKTRPHILEMICLSLDFESFKKCLKVSRAWSGVLTSKVFLTKVKLVFSKDIIQDEITLRKMSREGDTHGVRRILSSGLVNVDCCHCVCRESRGIKLVLQHSDDCDDGHDTPLILAATMGHQEIMRLLINAGANVNWCGPTDLGKEYNRKRFSPLIKATSYNEIEVVKLLIDAGAYIDQADGIGRTPLQYAVIAGCVDVINLLLDNGADINSADEDGTTSLILAIMIGIPANLYSDIVKLLIERGADLEKADEDGDTPLTKAVRYGMLEMVKLLIANGASLTHDAGGGTPVGLAFENVN